MLGQQGHQDLTVVYFLVKDGEEKEDDEKEEYSYACILVLNNSRVLRVSPSLVGMLRRPEASRAHLGLEQ